MEYKLKSISHAGIDEANSKAELYRLLNEPGECESICQDVLATDPQNQSALRRLAMAISDQFTGAPDDRYAEAEAIVQRLTDSYERIYCSGLLHERRAKAQLRAGRPPHTLLVLFEEALKLYEQAEKMRPAGNDDALLRWNRCVRILEGRDEADWNEKAEIMGIGDTGF